MRRGGHDGYLHIDAGHHRRGCGSVDVREKGGERMSEKENRPGEKPERSLQDIANDLRTEMRKRLNAETEIYLLTLELLNAIPAQKK